MNPRPPLGRVVFVAIVAVALIAALKLAFANELGAEAPFLLTALGVIISGWYGGTRGAALATLLSTVAIWYFFLPPQMSFDLPFKEGVKLLTFVLEGTLITATIHALHLARSRERQARERAEAAERFSATTLRSIGDAVIATDAAGRITFLNRVAEELTSFSSAEAFGRPLHEVFAIVSGRTREVVQNPVEHVLRAGKIVTLGDDTLLLSRSGRELSIADSGAPIRGDRGEIEGVVLVFRDVTAQQREEAQREFLYEASIVLGSSLDYRETLARLATLVVPRLADWAAVDLLKPETGELEQVALWHRDAGMLEVAQELRRRYPPDPGEKAGAYNVIRTGQAVLLSDIDEERLRASARDEQHAELLRRLRVRSAMVAPLSVGGASFGALTLVYAESDRRYEQHDLGFALDLARRAAVAVDNARMYAAQQQARELADAANHAKDEFLATVSHELRTPLNAIMGWANLLGRDLDSGKRGRAIETIGRNASAMAQLIDDLLDVSRIISGKMRLELKPLAPKAVVQAAIESIKPTAEAKQIDLGVAIDAAAGPVLADSTRLQQVVSNLLSNAVKFTPRGGRIHVSLSQREPMVEIAVSDTGKGIAASFLPHVFDAFRQADASLTRVHGGLGLGLAITRRLVETQGGRVEAQSEGEGRGATFKVLLPALVQAEPHAHTGAHAAPSAAQLDAGLRVLVVEDDPDARDLLQEVLGAAGCHVTAATAVGDALEALERDRPDVLLSDLAMPGETGFDLIRRVRALPADKGGNIPAAALTAYASLEDRRRVLQAGFMMHVPKPIEPEELLSVVESLARIGSGRISVPP